MKLSVVNPKKSRPPEVINVYQLNEMPVLCGTFMNECSCKASSRVPLTHGGPKSLESFISHDYHHDG